MKNGDKMAAVIAIALLLLVGYVVLARIYTAGRLTIALGKMLASHDRRDRVWAFATIGSIFFLIVMSAAVGFGWAIVVLVTGGLLSAGGWVYWTNRAGKRDISMNDNSVHDIDRQPPPPYLGGEPQPYGIIGPSHPGAYGISPLHRRRSVTQVPGDALPPSAPQAVPKNPRDGRPPS